MTQPDTSTAAVAAILKLGEGITPGPWRIVIDDDGNPLSGRPSISASDELDCGIVHWDGFVQEYWRSARGDKEIHANATAIAAVPDMLALISALAEDRDELRQQYVDANEAAIDLRIETGQLRYGAESARRSALEQAARVAEEYQTRHTGDEWAAGYSQAAISIEDAIRALAEKEQK